MNHVERKNWRAARPELRFEGDEVVADFEQKKAAANARFESNETGYTISDWRDEIGSLNDKIIGAHARAGTDFTPGESKHPEDKALEEFNALYQQAKTDPNDKQSAIDWDKLSALQAEFFARHPDPEVRKYIIDFQTAGKVSPAEKLYAEDMARLNGFDPSSGKPLTFPDATGAIDRDMRELVGQPVPPYFDMNRWEWSVIDNDASKEYLDRFEQWKQGLAPRLQQTDRADLIALFMKSPEGNTAPDGQPWNAIRRNDIFNYGKDSKETAEYRMWRYSYPELTEWLDGNNYWSTIQDLHNK